MKFDSKFMNKNLFSLIIIAISFINCSRTKKDLEYIICANNLQYWDLISFNEQKAEVISTYCFRKDGTYITYDIERDNTRRIMTYSTGEVAIEKWSISNDSILMINVGYSKITRYNSDTIFLGNNKTSDILVRIKNKINIRNRENKIDSLLIFKALPPI